MIYRAVGNLIAVDFSELTKRVTTEEAETILRDRGFEIMDVNLSELARNWVGSNIRYKRGAKMSEAPMRVSCSSFMKWLFSQKGIDLPRRALQQKEFGKPCHGDPAPECLIFKTGAISYYREREEFGIGHVGMVTDRGTVIHATNAEPAVEEVSLKEFIGDPRSHRGARRIVERPEKTKTLRIPAEYEIETSDDLNFIIWGHVGGYLNSFSAT